MGTATVADLGPPIAVLHHLAPERRALLDLLDGLAPADWRRPTACPGWSVFDVAAHLAGDDLGRLARSRDHAGGVGPRPGEAFPRFIDRINGEWVVAAARLSPRLLVDLLAWSGAQVVELWRGTDLQALGEPVSWAAAGPAPVWLDLARDFSEYWAHQQQIRDAIGLGATGGPDRREWLAAVLDTYLRGLPATLATHAPAAPVGASVTFEVTTGPGGAWTAGLGADGWSVARGGATAASAHVRLDAESTWRLATRGLTPEAAAARASVQGDRALGGAALHLLSIIR